MYYFNNVDSVIKISDNDSFMYREDLSTYISVNCRLKAQKTNRPLWRRFSYDTKKKKKLTGSDELS